MENKIDTITNLFEGSEIRSIWDSEKEDYYFSVVDVIGALTDSLRARISFTPSPIIPTVLFSFNAFTICCF